MGKYTKHDTAVVSPKARIGDNTRIWAFVNIADGAKIGKDCNICDGCYVEEGSTVGDHVTLKNGVHVFEGIHIEDNVFCGANVSFINDKYPRSNRQDSWTLEEVHVKKGATLGSNATILCGVTIGEYSFVGAGSVVTKDVPAYTLVFGNPAKNVGYVCSCGKRLKDDMTCECGCKYSVENQSLSLSE